MVCHFISFIQQFISENTRQSTANAATVAKQKDRSQCIAHGKPQQSDKQINNIKHGHRETCLTRNYGKISNYIKKKTDNILSQNRYGTLSFVSCLAVWIGARARTITEAAVQKEHRDHHGCLGAHFKLTLPTIPSDAHFHLSMPLHTSTSSLQLMMQFSVPFWALFTEYASERGETKRVAWSMLKSTLAKYYAIVPGPFQHAFPRCIFFICANSE